MVSDSTLDADGTVDIGLTLRPPPVATPPRAHRKPDMLVHSVMICCRSSFVISGICGRDEIVLELLPILRLRICGQYHICTYVHISVDTITDFNTMHCYMSRVVENRMLTVETES